VDNASLPKFGFVGAESEENAREKRHAA